MDVIAHLERRLETVERQLSSVVRLAQVTDIDLENTLLTCKSEGLEQSGVPLFTFRAGEDKTYWMPSVGELGYLISPSGDIGNAVFLPGIFYSNFPSPEQSLTKAIRVYRDDQIETIDTKEGSYTYENGDLKRVIDTEKIEDSAGGTKQTINIQKIEQVAGMNIVELSAILFNILGLHILPTGITGIQTATGPGFFIPTPSPTAPPAPPAGSEPDDDGNITKVPPSDVTGVGMSAGRISFTIPGGTPITGAVAGPYPVVGVVPNLVVNVNFTASGVTVSFPAKDL